MKFEKLNVDTNKRGIWILYGLILGVVLIIIINYFISMAKYKVVDTTKLVSSNINYKLPDLTVLGIYVKEGEEYKYVETIPEGNYTINKELSSCTKKGGEEIKDIIEYREDSLYIGINERGTRCKVYLDKQISAKDTLDKLTGLSVNTAEQGCPTIDNEGNATIDKAEDTEGLLCQAKDNDGATYYFRGVPTNNWVKIDKTYWQIVRINGDGSIRLIYNGSSINRQATDTIITTGRMYNSDNNDNAYIGFMYGATSQSGSGAYDKTHANTNPSIILSQLKTWYMNSFPETYKEYIDGNAGFCNDRSPYASSSSGNIDTHNYGFGNSNTSYGGYVRMTSKKPTFKCPQDNDLFTIPGSKKGNQALNVEGVDIPVGLITADEIMYAGAGLNTNYKNQSYYLYNGKHYWTMSPSFFNNSIYSYGAYIFSVRGDYGYLDIYSANKTNTDFGVRPVINLKANTPFKEGGDGSSSNPFVVELN